VFVRGGDVEKAIRRLRKACEQQGVMSDMRRLEHRRKPSEQRRIKHLRILNRQRKAKKLFGEP